MATTTEATDASAGRGSFVLRTLERVDATAGTAVLRIAGTLDTPGSTKAPILYLEAATSGVLRPVWVARRGAAWTAEYAVAAQRLDQGDAALLLVLPDGRLVDLPTPRPARRRPHARGVALGIAAAAAVGAGAWSASQATPTEDPSLASARPALGDSPGRAAEHAGRSSPRAAVAATPRGMRLVARATTRRVGLYRSPTATRAWTFLRSPNAMGAPTVLLVEAAAGDRFEVALPIRPNGSTAWVRAADVRLSRVEHRVDVDLTRHRLTVLRRGRVIARSATGVGRSLTPTPSGVYYVTALLEQPDPSGIYGPYAFALSAHSTVLDEFAGGNGRIGLHGTNDPSGIGSDVSHGCIRVPNAVIRRLARMLALGTPVHITR